MPSEPDLDKLDMRPSRDEVLIDWNEHRLDRDWQAATRTMNTIKALAIADTLDHLSDLEAMCDRDDNVSTATEIRSLAAKLKSLKRDYEGGAEFGA
jgi:hypothetical protein